MSNPLTIYHYGDPFPGDCVHGVLTSIARGYAGQDINAQCLADLVFAAAHWGAVGPKGGQNPWGGIKAGTPLSTITAAGWRKLRPIHGGPERPATLSDIIAAVAGRPFVPCFEIKPGAGSHRLAPYDDLKIAAVQHGVPCLVMTIQADGSTAKARADWEASAKLRMKAAGAAGLPRLLLWRHNIPANSDWWGLLDAVKGAPASQKTPAHIVRVPLTSTHAAARTVLTKVTATVHWGSAKPAPKPAPPSPKPPEAPVSTAAKVIAIARAEIGYREGFSGGHWNNDEKYAAQVPGLAWANYQPWCDTGVAWCFWEAGVLDLLPGGPTASVAVSRDRWRAAKRFSEYPAVGAQAIFGKRGDAHTGLVVAYGPTTITLVEFNTNADGSPEGNGVYLKTRNRRDPFVYGYGYPAYPEGIDSADPAWAKRKPAPSRVTPTAQGDDMPYSDWPKADQDALVADIAKAVWSADVVPWPTKGKPKNTIWATTAMSRILKAVSK